MAMAHVIYCDRPSKRGFMPHFYIKVVNSLKQIVIEEAVLIQEGMKGEEDRRGCESVTEKATRRARGGGYCTAV